MEAFGTMGFMFGMMGFVFAMSALSKIDALEKKLNKAGVFGTDSDSKK